jgi:predicted ATP-grasp superfamily ATP-dependent carboligase
MADRFLLFDDLLDAVTTREFERPPALVANAHITGLGVARALSSHGIPVIAVDRSGDGVAPPSNAVDLAGQVTYPLDDPAGFRADVERLAAELTHEPVAFGCMDEWVYAFATEPEGVRLPFDPDAVDAVLDKYELYRRAAALDVPVPETYFLDETAPETAADALEFPFVVKPALKRRFEEAIGTNVVEVGDREAFADVVATATAEDIRILAQEKVNTAVGRDHSLASYVPPEGDPLALVGNPVVRYPPGYGTSTVVDAVDRRVVEKRATAVIEGAGYHGISESEFVYDRDREEFVLLDINTRPWKWIDMPVTAGANLPLAAYADVTGVTGATGAMGATDTTDRTADAGTDDGGVVPRTDRDPPGTRWVYLPDYLSLLFEEPTFEDVLHVEQWHALLSGAFETGSDLTTGVYRSSDTGPAYAALENRFARREYYCSC